MKRLAAFLVLACLIATPAFATIQYNSNNTSTGFDVTTANTLPTGWTNNNGGSWTASTSAPTGTNHTQTFSDASKVVGSLATLTGLGPFTDMEVTGTVEITTNASNQTSSVDYGVRGNSGGTNGYMFQAYKGASGNFFLAIYKQTGATSFTALAGPTAIGTLGNGNFYISARFQIIGTTLKGKAWQTSGTEPSAWGISATDSTYSSGYAWLRNDESISGTVAGITDFGVNDTPSGATTSIIAYTPLSQIANGATVTGAYTGTAPTGLNYAIDGGSFSALSSPTISGGAISFAMPTVTTAYHTLYLQSQSVTTVTTATPAFKGTAPPGGGVTCQSLAATGWGC